MRCSSVCVERLVWVQEVAGSSPVTAIDNIKRNIGLAMIAMREYSKGGLTNCRYICSQSKHYDFPGLHVTNGDSF